MKISFISVLLPGTETCNGILVTGDKLILDPAVLLAEHRKVFPELPPQGLQVLSDGTCQRGQDLPLRFIEKFTQLVTRHATWSLLFLGGTI